MSEYMEHNGAGATDNEPDAQWRDRPASLESRLERIADGQDRLAGAITALVGERRPPYIDLADQDDGKRAPEKYASVSIADSSYTTIEALLDRSRQMYSTTQELCDSLGGLIYGPAPTSAPSAGFATPTDRFEATLLYMQESIDNVARVAAELRRRA